jgi:hypothetical protein
MLGLFGKKSDHPMAELKSAQTLLEGLSKSDPLKSLQEVTTWIESVREQEEFRLDHQLAVLRLLDETARPFERKLTRDYFSAGNLPIFQENRLWMVLNEFFRQLAQAYFHVLTRYRNGDKGGSAVKPVLALVAARAICAVAGRLKCAAAHYALVEPEMWEYLAEFYAHAEAQKYLDEQVTLYAGANASTSVRYEFAGVLVWYASCAQTLGRLQVHMAERLTAHLNKNLAVGAQHGPSCLFGFDLQHPAPPMRVSAETPPQPGLRFLGVNNMQTPIESLLKTLKKGVVPEEINLDAVYSVEAISDVLRYLAKCWTSVPRKRRNARHNIKVNMHVAKGFSGILEHTDVSLNFSNDTGASWEVYDISTSGFRGVLPASRANGVMIGLLVGIKPEKLDHWGVGIVRRMSRDPDNNLQVGVEILTNQITGVGLREDNVDGERPALWLDRPSSDANEASLLIGPDTFSSSRSLHMRLGDRHYLLMPLELVEQGEDYDLARYRKIEEDLNADEAN